MIAHRHGMAVLSVICVLAIWALRMPKPLLVTAIVVSAILILNAIFRIAD